MAGRRFEPAQRHSECEGKVRYPDKRAAVSQRNLILNGHRRKRPDSLREYACPVCTGWHLTKR